MFAAAVVVISMLLVVAFGQQYPKVPVAVYYEALCPGMYELFTVDH